MILLPAVAVAGEFAQAGDVAAAGARGVKLESPAGGAGEGEGLEPELDVAGGAGGIDGAGGVDHGCGESVGCRTRLVFHAAGVTRTIVRTEALFDVAAAGHAPAVHRAAAGPWLDRRGCHRLGEDCGGGGGAAAGGIS